MNAIDLLARCYPFHQLEAEVLKSLKSKIETRDIKRGQTLLRRGSAMPDKWSYLVSGSAELRRSFFDRQALQAGADPALQALDYLLLGEGGQIVALEDCVVAQVSRDILDRSLASNASNDYSVAALHDVDLTTDYLVSDSAVSVDWMSRFLQSPLAHNLPASSIQHVLASLEHRDVAHGEDIVRKGEVGDAIYVLTRGVATICTDEHSAFGGREIALIAGDYFGEESLVADTLRNATVTMEADGSVARLDRAVFDQYIRPHLVREADDDLMERCLTADTDKSLAIIDVRFPIEYRHDALPTSTNIPIPLLRARLSLLDKTRTHLVTRHGGRRSELAVFLLRQAGIEAYLMASASHRFAHIDAYDNDAFGERVASS
ncbi:MAG: cyclic nucleotide-binding domain-containing protein [Spongiibacteraceae bacterium]